jgi:hypothetical protein
LIGFDSGRCPCMLVVCRSPRRWTMDFKPHFVSTSGGRALGGRPWLVAQLLVGAIPTCASDSDPETLTSAPLGGAAR